jgi:hypothetical protein
MATKTEAIKAFLKIATHPDLAALYHHDMECQVIVAQDNGERLEGEFKGVKWSGYTDGLQVWKAFRCPRNANTNPEYEDTAIRFDLSAHAEGIGMTGFDWVHKVSRWIAFDFDAIAGHDKHVKAVSDEDLQSVREAAISIPWVTTRYSTGGQGLHLYVFLDPVPTQNHTEHAALARAILAHMSALTGFSFVSKVDACGSNMWVWHRKMKGTRGLQLIKQGTTLETPPANWQAHIGVVNGRTRKIKHNLPNSTPDIEQSFESLIQQSHHIPLDVDHKRLITYLEENGLFFWYDADNHMLVTHVAHLKAAHTALNLKGIFETITKATNPNEQNCFCFPMAHGAWSVRRFSLGTIEHPSWQSDAKGWTRCFLNRAVDLRTASLTHNGVEDPHGGYVFQSVTDAKEAALCLGAIITTPPTYETRPVIIKTHRDGVRLVIEVQKSDIDKPTDMHGWLATKGKKWTRVLNASLTSPSSETETIDFDDTTRHLVDANQEDGGWVIKSNGKWIDEPLIHIRAALDSTGLSGKEVKQVIGGSIFKPWQLVIKPFQAEYLGDRTWNRGAPQFCFVPSIGEDLTYPTWTSILNHVGNTLTPYLQVNPWAQANGIRTGADYLKCWIASVFQFPYDHLPYLFIYGMMQNTGKSLFHEAISLLLRPGYVRADQALRSKGDFNGELSGAIICALEEVDLNKDEVANARIKDWVTGTVLSIHKKGATPYQVPNMSHWIQCTNYLKDCPIFPGDTRITMVHVPNPHPNPVPKHILFERLVKEAPDFLAELLRLEIPPPCDRLRIPTLETADKVAAIDVNQNALERFLQEKCFYSPGKVMLLSDFYDAFIGWCDPQEALNWATKQSVSRKMPDRYAKGRIAGSASWYWANISLDVPTEEEMKRAPMMSDGERLHVIPTYVK